MSDILIHTIFCVSYTLVPIVALLLLSYTGISLRRFSIPSLFVIYYVTFAYIGSMPLYFGWNMESLPAGMVDPSILVKLFLFSGTALLTIIAGFVFARHVIGIRAGTANRHAIGAAQTMQSIFIFFLFLLCILILHSYIRQVETVALFKAIDGDVMGAAVARSQMGSDFKGTYWHYKIFFRQLLDYCVLFFFADYLIKQRVTPFFLFLASFFVASFSATMAIEKGPFVNLLVMLYLTYVICRGGNYWQPVAKYLLFFLPLIIAVGYIYFMGAPDISTALMFIPARVFMGQLSPAYFYLDLFPDRVGYLFGTSFPNPGGLLPFQSYPLTTEVARLMSPESFAQGITGSAPTVFWAEMYANFGPAGISFSSFWVGVGLFVISFILSKLTPSPPVIAATVSMAMHYAFLSGTSFSNYVFDATLAAIATVTCLSILLGNTGSAVSESPDPRASKAVPLNAE